MTRPEISLDTLERVLERQGHLPMRPSDVALMRASIAELRDSVTHLKSAARNPGEIVTDLDVVALARAGGFPGRSNVVPFGQPLRGRVGA